MPERDVEPLSDSRWTVLTRDGKRATILSFPTRKSAERKLDEWRAREARGGRPDVTTEGMHVGPDPGHGDA